MALEYPDGSFARATDEHADESVIAGLRHLASLSRAITGRELREQMVEHARRFFQADAAALWRLESRERTWRISAATGLSSEYPAVSIAAREGTSADSLLPAPMLIEDVFASPMLEERRRLYVSEGVVSLLVLPLHIRGETAGTIACYYRTKREAFTRDELDCAATFAEIASIALSTERFDRLAEVARDVAGSLDLNAVVSTITEAATALSGARFGAFFYNLVNESGESYMLYSISGAAPESFQRLPMPRITEVFARTFNGTGIVRSSNITKDPNYGHNAPFRGMPDGHLPVVSYLAVPVTSQTGEVIGGLLLGHEAEGVFGETEEKIVEALAGHAAVVIDNVRLYSSIERDRAALRAEERRYRSLVTSSPGQRAIVVLDADGNAADSTSWAAITGQAPEQIAGDGWLNAVHPLHRDRVRIDWRNAIARQVPFEATYLLRQPDGSYRWYGVKIVPVRSEAGEVEEWVGTVADVHEQQVAAEGLEFLARANELFASSLDYLETLESVTFLAVPRIADWCAVDMVPSSGERLWDRLAVAHIDPEKIALAEEFQRKYPPDPETDAIYRVMRTGTSELIPYISDDLLAASARSPEHLRMMRELGIMSVMIVPLRSRGEVIGAITFVASDRRFTRQDLAHAEQLAYRASIAIENASLYSAAQSANRAKDEFLATLSHELRTPMTAVLGWARMLKLGLSQEETRVAIEAIEQSASAQAQLIEDVLDVSRIMAGKLTFEPRPIDMRTVAQAAITTVHPAAVAKGIEILTSIPPLLPQVAGDEGRLQQVIWNLLANAIKFTPRGGAVTLRLAQEGSVVRLAVSDNGEGIDRAFLPYVFEPFRQADSSPTRPHGGIGLGLAIVRSLVEMHGGKISASSRGKGEGSTFTVELPVLESAPAIVARPELEIPSDVAAPSTSLPSLAGLSILLIDDQEYTRDAVAAILRHAGAEVRSASSVRDGLQQFEAATPTVVVCDIAMPEEDGYAFLRQIRDLGDDRRRVPILALTAFGRPEDRLRALDAGFDAYVKKPVDPSELTEAIQRLAARG